METTPIKAMSPRRLSDKQLREQSSMKGPSLHDFDSPLVVRPKTPFLEDDLGRSPQSSKPPHRSRRSASTEHISTHALERLGVDLEVLKKEKGMKKLGICDEDIARSEELRRYSGIVVKRDSTPTKKECILGFSEEQLQRVKAVKHLGTSEHEIWEDYSKRVSGLGSNLKGTPRK